MRETDTIEVRAKDYLPLIWILVAAILGFGLLCGAAAVGVNDINASAPIGTPSVGVVEFLVSNINTVIAETVVAFSDVVSGPTSGPSLALTDMSIPLTGATSSATPTTTVSPTSTFFFFTRTFVPPTRTFTPTKTPTSTPSNTPTFTPTSTPSNTPTNTPTDTPEPTFTPSPTDTLIPSPTDTLVPTDTPIPTDTLSAPDPLGVGFEGSLHILPALNRGQLCFCFNHL